MSAPAKIALLTARARGANGVGPGDLWTAKSIRTVIGRIGVPALMRMTGERSGLWECPSLGTTSRTVPAKSRS